ncbi:MAG TPA: HI0074 family nucleotidyltransferase substrate-binding subunit [Candidatus Babeliales bacterium]|nr:HI0074 family nucleotidyltransferase substrate-binding subunit [Candidatus Babeliales bacterium]
MEETIHFEKFKKAIAVFENFRQDMRDDRDKAGAVQAFEFCYELAWKYLKRVLAMRGLETASPKDTFRKAAQEKLIDDPEIWFEFQKKRNLTVHVYERATLDEVVSIFDIFSQELEKLISRLERLTV